MLSGAVAKVGPAAASPLSEKAEERGLRHEIAPGIVKLHLGQSRCLNPLNEPHILNKSPKKESGVMESQDINWIPGTNALLHMKCFAYFTPAQSDAWQAVETRIQTAKNTPCTRHTCHEKHPSSLMKKSSLEFPGDACQGEGLGKPIRTLIRDTGVDGAWFELRIGRGFTCPALEKCVRALHLHETARFLIQPEQCLTYAKLEFALLQEDHSTHHARSGCCASASPLSLALHAKAAILVGCTLEFHLTLAATQSPHERTLDVWEVTSFVERLALARASKEQGVNAYQSRHWVIAKTAFTRALEWIVGVHEHPWMAERRRFGHSVADGSLNAQVELVDLEGLTLLLHQCQLNMAAVCLALEDWEGTREYCTRVLTSSPYDVKALFRRAKATTRQGRDLELAEKDLLQLQAILTEKEEPSSSSSYHQDWQHEWKLLQAAKRQHAQKERFMYSNLFTKA